MAIPIAAAVQILLHDIWQHRGSSLVDSTGEPLLAVAAGAPPRDVQTQPAEQTKT